MSDNQAETALPGVDEDRLSPQNLERSARWLLKHNDDHVALVASLLKTIRENDDQQNAIRRGYEFSYRFEEELHTAELDAEHLHIARAIEREARRGDLGAAPNQQLTYSGGLRRAARIARGWRTSSQRLVPVESSEVSE